MTKNKLSRGNSRQNKSAKLCRKSTVIGRRHDCAAGYSHNHPGAHCLHSQCRPGARSACIIADTPTLVIIGSAGIIVDTPTLVIIGSAGIIADAPTLVVTKSADYFGIHAHWHRTVRHTHSQRLCASSSWSKPGQSTKPKQSGTME
jgi:hypothetical protein